MYRLKNFWQKGYGLIQHRVSRILLTVGLIVFVVVTLIYVIYANWALLLNFEWQINFWALALSFLFYSLNLIAIIVGWHLIMGYVANCWQFWGHFNIYVMSDLAKRVPGSLWHVVGRVMMYEQLGVKKSLVVLGSGIEAILMIISSILAYLFAYSFSQSNPYFAWWLPITLIISLILIHPRVIHFALKKFKNIPHPSTRLSYQTLLSWLLFYIMGWSLGGLILFSLINIITPLSYQFIPDVIAAWALAGVLSSLIFFSPSGLGVQEITLSLMIGQLIPEPVAIIVAVLLRILITFYQICWVAFVILIRRYLPTSLALLPKDY